MSSKPNRIKKIRKMLKLPRSEDKVICFIPEWERGRDYCVPLESEEKEYVIQEQRLFHFMINRLLFYNNLSFIAYDESDRDNDDAVRIIRAIPNIPEFADWFLNKKLRSHYGMKVLCIDYKYFGRNISYDFFRYIEESFIKRKIGTETLDKDAPPLFRLFRDVGINIKMTFATRVREIIDMVEKRKFSEEEQSLIDFFSNHHIQNILVPTFWHKVRKKGFLCEYNKQDTGSENLKNPADGEKKEDVRFFYSFESLLFWELKNIFIETKRCRNCNEPLPWGYKRAYCSKGSSNYEKCHKERQNARSSESYKRKKEKKSNKILTN